MKPNNDKISNKNILLIWAPNAAEAKFLYCKYNKKNPAEYEMQLSAIKFSKDQIHLPDEVLRLRMPAQFEGEERIVKNPQGKSVTYIIPDFLNGCRTAVIYARVSTRQQRHNSSFGRQREACELFAQAAGVKVVRCYEEVESGNLYLSRPLLQQALRDIESGVADILLVESMDRLLRDVEINAEIPERIQTAGGFLIFCEEQRIQSPDHRFAMCLVHQANKYKQRMLQLLGLI